MNLVGINPAYFQKDELVRPTELQRGVAALKRGTFYEVGLVVKDAQTLTTLNIGKPINVDGENSAKSEQTVYKHLELGDYNKDVLVSYYFFDPTEADERNDFDESLANLDDPRTDVKYQYVKGTSKTGPVVDHTHDAQAMYRFENVAVALLQIIEHNNVSVDGILDALLAPYQTVKDNRLNTLSKEIVGGINEIKAVVEALDFTGYQSRNDNRLVTQSQQVVGAINELNARLDALYDGGAGSLNMKGLLSGRGVVDLTPEMGAESKVWVVGNTVTLKGDFGDRVSTYAASAGDVVYYDAETNQHYVQGVSSVAKRKLDKEPYGLNGDISDIGLAVASYYGVWAALAGNDPTTKFYGYINSDTDLTLANHDVTGDYTVTKDGVKVRANFGVVEERTFNAGQKLTYDYSSGIFSVGVAEPFGARAIANGLSLGNFKTLSIVAGLNEVIRLIRTVTGHDTDALELAGAITGDTDLSNLDGSEVFIVYASATVTGPFYDGAVFVNAKAGDVIYRKRSTGKLHHNNSGGLLELYLDKTSSIVDGSIVDYLVEADKTFKASDVTLKVIGKDTTIPAPENAEDAYYVGIMGATVTGPGMDGEETWVLNADDKLAADATGSYWIVGKYDKSELTNLPAYSEALKSSNKSLVDAINEMAENGVRSTIETGDLIYTDRVLDSTFAVPCDGGRYKVSDYPVLGSMVGDRWGGDGKTIFVTPKGKGKRGVNVDNREVVVSKRSHADGDFIAAITGLKKYLLYGEYDDTLAKGSKWHFKDLETGAVKTIDIPGNTYTNPRWAFLEARGWAPIANTNMMVALGVCGTARYVAILDPDREHFPDGYYLSGKAYSTTYGVGDLVADETGDFVYIMGKPSGNSINVWKHDWRNDTSELYYTGGWGHSDDSLLTHLIDGICHIRNSTNQAVEPTYPKDFLSGGWDSGGWGGLQFKDYELDEYLGSNTYPNMSRGVYDPKSDTFIVVGSTYVERRLYFIPRNHSGAVSAYVPDNLRCFRSEPLLVSTESRYGFAPIGLTKDDKLLILSADSTGKTFEIFSIDMGVYRGHYLKA